MRLFPFAETLRSFFADTTLLKSHASSMAISSCY